MELKISIVAVLQAEFLPILGVYKTWGAQQSVQTVKQTHSTYAWIWIWRQHMSLQISNISLRINVTFTYMQNTHALPDAAPYHYRGLVFALLVRNSLDGLFPLGPENSAAFLCKINKCLLLCKIQFQVAFFDAVADCVKWQWFSKVLPSPCGYVHHDSMAVSQTIQLEGLMVMGIQQRFQHRDFPWPPEYFHNIMNCGWWKFFIFAILHRETLSLNWLTILSRSLAQSGEPRPILACKE